MKNLIFLRLLLVFSLFLCQCQNKSDNKPFGKIAADDCYKVLYTQLESMGKIENPHQKIDALTQLLDWGTTQLGRQDSAIAQLHIALGTAYYNDYQLQKSVQTFQEANTLWLQADSTRFSANISDNYLNIASVLDDIGNYHLAMNYYEKALTAFIQVKDTNLIAETYQLMGVVATNLKDSSNIILHEKGLSILALKNKPNREMRATLWQNKGVDLANNRQYSQSLALFNNVLTYYRAENDSSSIASTAIEMAKNYLHQGIYSNAINYANQALSKN